MIFDNIVIAEKDVEKVEEAILSSANARLVSSIGGIKIFASRAMPENMMVLRSGTRIVYITNIGDLDASDEPSPSPAPDRDGD